MGAIDIHAKVTVEIFPDRVNQLTDTPDGPVGRFVKHAAEVVLVASLPRIGDRYSGQHLGPRIRDTGKVVSIGGSAYAVVFDHPIAFLHHEGKTSGYTITPHNPKNILSNRNVPARTAGGPFFAKGPVIWTGYTGGNPFMRDAAESVGLRPSGALQRGKRLTSLFRLPS